MGFFHNLGHLHMIFTHDFIWADFAGFPAGIWRRPMGLGWNWILRKSNWNSSRRLPGFILPAMLFVWEMKGNLGRYRAKSQVSSPKVRRASKPGRVALRPNRGFSRHFWMEGLVVWHWRLGFPGDDFYDILLLDMALSWISCQLIVGNSTTAGKLRVVHCQGCWSESSLHFYRHVTDPKQQGQIMRYQEMTNHSGWVQALGILNSIWNAQNEFSWILQQKSRNTGDGRNPAPVGSYFWIMKQYGIVLRMGLYWDKPPTGAGFLSSTAPCFCFLFLGQPHSFSKMGYCFEAARAMAPVAIRHIPVQS